MRDPATASVLPSLENTPQRYSTCGSCTRQTARSLATSQMRTVPSREAEASALPSGENDRSVTRPSWPVSARFLFLGPRSRTAMAPSCPAEASQLPSDEKANAYRAAEDQRKVFTSCPVVAS